MSISKERQSKWHSYIHPGQLGRKSCPGWDSNPQHFMNYRVILTFLSGLYWNGSGVGTSCYGESCHTDVIVGVWVEVENGVRVVRKQSNVFAGSQPREGLRWKEVDGVVGYISILMLCCQFIPCQSHISGANVLSSEPIRCHWRSCTHTRWEGV